MNIYSKKSLCCLALLLSTHLSMAQTTVPEASTGYYLSDTIHKKDLKKVWKNYLKIVGVDEKALKKIAITANDLGGFQYDIDGDGTEDWIISLNSSYFCGSKMACSVYIFPSTLANKVIETCIGIDVNQEIQFSGATSNGFYDLQVTGKSEAFKYNGEQYCIADSDNNN